MTWNPLDTDPDITLSSGDRVATATVAGWNVARGVPGRNAGRYYFEGKALAVAAGLARLGIVGYFTPLDLAWPGSAAFGAGYGIDGEFWVSGANTTSGLTVVNANDVIGVDVDFVANTVTFRVQDVVQITQAIPVGKPMYPAVGLNTSTSFEGAFSLADFTYTPPAGALPWVGTPPTIPGWSDAHKGADLQLSNYGYTASLGTSSWNAVRTADLKSTGDLYFEIACDSTTSGLTHVGVLSAVGSVNHFLGSGAQGTGYSSNGDAWDNNTNAADGDPYTTGDVIGVRAIFATDTVEFYKNGVLQFSRLMLASTPMAPAVSLFDFDVATLRLTAAEFTETIPAGASAWESTPTTQDAVAVATGTIDWIGEAQSAPAATQDAIAVATGVVNWTGEAQSTAASTQDAVAVATGVINWTGEAQSTSSSTQDAVAVATGTINWAGEAQSAAPPVEAQGAATASINWIGEPESFITPEQQRVIDSGFTGFVVLSPAFAAASGLTSLSLPYDKSDSETLERRTTTTETNEGAYTFDGGFFEAGRVFSFVIEGASRDQIDTAKAYLKIGLVHISHWDGYYECIMQSVSAPNAELTLEMVVNRKLSDVEAA